MAARCTHDETRRGRVRGMPPGFTLIELLVVMGIILVLLAIVVFGVRHVNNTAARQVTEVQLKVCMDMLKEYQSANGLKNIEGAPNSMPAGADVRLPWPPWLNEDFLLPLFIDVPPNAGESLYTQPVSALGIGAFAGSPGGSNPAQSPGGAGDMSRVDNADNARWVADAVRWTQATMYILLKDPANREMMAKMPPRQVLETPPPYSPNNAPNKPYTIEAAVPLDGWGNPIVFVPRGGIHVMMNPDNAKSGPEEYVVRTSGSYRIRVNKLAPVGLSDHPFFASAGQDYYFTDLGLVRDRGSDNVYSFQEQ